MKKKITWYCWKMGSHIVSRSIHGLLIRGIPESMIFQVKAETRIEASNKAAEIIKIYEVSSKHKDS